MEDTLRLNKSMVIHFFLILNLMLVVAIRVITLKIRGFHMTTLLRERVKALVSLHEI